MSSNLTAPTMPDTRRRSRFHRLAAAPVLVLALVVLFGPLLSGCGRDAADAEAAMHAGRYDVSLALVREGAAAGDAAAMNLLAVHHHLGLGVTRSPEEAARWYERAAIAGSADARRNLGTLYQLGVGVPQDRSRAYAWYFAAARQGQPKAQDYIQSMANELTPNQIRQAKTWIHGYLREQGSPVPVEVSAAELNAE